MDEVRDAPCRVHILVCANGRPPGGMPSCGEVGEAVFARLKGHALRTGVAHEVWVTRTGCLGLCHAAGAALAIHRPGGEGRSVFLQAVQVDEVEEVLRRYAGRAG